MEDADALTINTAISYNERCDSVVVVGEDVDLLVLLTQFAHEKKNIYFMKAGKNNENKSFDSTSFKYEPLANLIMFIHAFSGADTTSSFFKNGKIKFIKPLIDDIELRMELQCFNTNNADPSDLVKAG